ncbi:hypothetical protein GC163_20165 [bacterium]|nr:hypothetical protein [bacterium]
MSLQLMSHLVQHGTPVVVPITVEQYLKMMSAGILREGMPIELIDGILLYKDRRDEPTKAMTQGPRHLLTIKLLAQLLEQLISTERYHVQQQGPVICNDDSAPEPDICILNGQPTDYAEGLPKATDVGLIIEVAQSSLSLDQNDKADLYGASGIPVYWIINLVDDSLMVHTEPNCPNAGYAQCHVYRRGMTAELKLPEGESLSLAVDDLLPQRDEP